MPFTHLHVHSHYSNNREHDWQNEELLRANGWQVITLWACNLTKDRLEPTIQQVVIALSYESRAGHRQIQHNTNRN